MDFKIGLLIFCVSIQTSVFGETLELKTGETIDGKIIGRFEQYLSIEVPYGIIHISYDDLSKTERFQQTTLFKRQKMIENVGHFSMDKAELISEKSIKENIDLLIEHYENIISISPKNVNAYLVLGLCYAEKDEFKKSLNAYIKAVNLNSANPVLHSILALAYSRFGMYEDAIIELKQAIYLDPANPLYHYSLGKEFLRGKDYESAIAQFEKAIDLDKSFLEPYLSLIQIYLDLKMNNHALYYAQRAYEENPDEAEAKATLMKLRKDIK